MKKPIYSTIISTFALILTILLLFSVTSVAQEGKKEKTEKKYAELIGTYKLATPAVEG